MAKVLVVDDATIMRMSIKDILSKNGFEIVGEAVNGKEAVLKYNELKPDVVTMDITMPEMDGIQAVREIIAIDPKAKILMVSALGQQAMVLNAMKEGAKSFIVKPFQMDRFIDAVKSISQG